MWKNGLFKIIFVIVCIAIFSTFSFAEVADGHYKYIDNVPYYIPKAGFVPDKVTAIKIAVAVWIPIYGEKEIEDQKPYEAVLKDGIWYVSGFLPEDFLGGTAEAEIVKENGKIIRISHGE